MSLGDFLLRVFIAVFSAGWLFPLWLTLRAMIAFVNVELLPQYEAYRDCVRRDGCGDLHQRPARRRSVSTGALGLSHA